MSDKAPIVRVFAPEWDEENDKWVVITRVRVPWIRGEAVITTKCDGRFEPPASEALTTGTTLKALSDARAWILKQLPYVPGINDDEYEVVTGLIEPDLPPPLTPGEPDEQTP